MVGHEKQLSVFFLFFYFSWLKSSFKIIFWLNIQFQPFVSFYAEPILAVFVYAIIQAIDLNVLIASWWK